jgi:RNA polymerase sigma-70 factor (ECF subfamily)
MHFCLTLLGRDVDGWSPTPWPVAQGSSVASSAAESTEVAAAVRALAAEHRSVILETFYRRRNVPQAAHVLGVSADIVKARCYEALRELRLALAERGVST